MKTGAGGGSGLRSSNLPPASLKDDASYTWVGDGVAKEEGNPKKRSREADPDFLDLLRTLSTSVTNLSHQIATLSLDHKTNSVLIKEAIKEAKSKPEEEGEVCYAVAFGKGGVQGIFNHPGEVAPLVVGVPNNQHKRCSNRAEA